jgi:hypothetical protein
MGFLDKAKAAAEQAAAKTKEGVADVQTKRDLGKAYAELGEKAFELASSGAISHPELDPIVARIRELKEQAEREPVLAGATTTASTEPPPSDAPPAMPS